MNRILGILALMMTATCLTLARADHMSPWEEGWANMPNDIHNTRFETRIVDNDAFLAFVMFGVGASTTNRFLVDETAAVEEALASGHRVDQIAARLVPQDGFLGAGWARYTLLDDETLVSRVLNIHVRLRLLTKNGEVANPLLDLTAENAGDKTVSALFRRVTGDTNLPYATCALVFDPVLIDTDADGIADYASYYLSLKEDATGLIEGEGACAVLDTGEPMPGVQVGDIVDIGVDEEPSVLTGSFSGSL